MRRSEALEGVRVIKFKDILGRYEAAEFTQLEAAELLGIGERTFRRWRVRFEDGEAGLLIEEAIEDETIDDDNGKRRAMMLRAAALPSRAGVIVNLSTALRTFVGLERQAFNFGRRPGRQPSRSRCPRDRRSPQGRADG